MFSDEICAKFGLKAKNSSFQSIESGLINDTMVFETENGEKYILQCVNTNIISDYVGLMNNIEKVTNHLKKKIKRNSSEKCLEFLSNIEDGKIYFVDDSDMQVYRVSRFIEHDDECESLSREQKLKNLYGAGVGFGRFQKELDDFDASTLVETLPDFHDTVKRYHKFWDVAKTNSKEEKFLERFVNAENAIKFVFYNRHLANKIMKPLNSGDIPVRVVHNDTKINNILVKDGKPVCVIDLDTVMPGSMLFDYGDAVRYACNTAKEDSVDLTKIDLDMDAFKAFTKGFLSETQSVLTKEETKLLPISPAVIAYELGIRFLTDYLDGDNYFRCDPARPNHNLERAISQFRLTQAILEKQGEMTRIVEEIIDKQGQKD